MKEKFNKWFDSGGWIVVLILVIFIVISPVIIYNKFHDCYTTRYEIIDKVQYDETSGTRSRTRTEHCYKLILKDAQNHITEKDVSVETWYNFEVGENILFGCDVCGKIDKNNMK